MPNDQPPAATVRVGQVWADNKPGKRDRTFRVLRLLARAPDYGRPTHAEVEPARRDEHGAWHRNWSLPAPTVIRLDRFRPTASGYRLMQDASEV